MVLYPIQSERIGTYHKGLTLIYRISTKPLVVFRQGSLSKLCPMLAFILAIPYPANAIIIGEIKEGVVGAEVKLCAVNRKQALHRNRSPFRSLILLTIQYIV